MSDPFARLSGLAPHVDHVRARQRFDRRRNSLRLRRWLAMGMTAATIVLSGAAALVIARNADQGTDVTATDVTGVADDANGDPAMPPVPSGDKPSQSPQDAARDDVHPAIARLSSSDRTRSLVSLRVPEGYWTVSRTPLDEEVEVGDPAGRYGIERILLPEYGEILFVDNDGRIRRAYPMPGLVPSWLHVTDRYVYAGRVGDGGLPASSVVRIDRGDWAAKVIVFPTEAHQTITDLGWRTAPGDVTIDELVTVGPPGGTVASWIGAVNVDVDAINRLMERDAWGPLTVVEGPPSRRSARITGTLHIDENCVTLTATDGQQVLLVWPSRNTVWDADAGAVRYGTNDATVTLADGHTVVFGGGAGGASWLESTDGLVSPPHPSCDTADVWFVGERG
jgi:hypothetical protein